MTSMNFYNQIIHNCRIIFGLSSKKCNSQKMSSPFQSSLKPVSNSSKPSKLLNAKINLFSSKVEKAEIQ